MTINDLRIEGRCGNYCASWLWRRQRYSVWLDENGSEIPWPVYIGNEPLEKSTRVSSGDRAHRAMIKEAMEASVAGGLYHKAKAAYEAGHEDRMAAGRAAKAGRVVTDVLRYTDALQRHGVVGTEAIVSQLAALDEWVLVEIADEIAKRAASDETG